MTVYIATLEGDYNPGGVNQLIGRGEGVETMDGLGDFFKSAAKVTISPITSVVKGSTHAIMETGRGIASGDIKRVIAAPFKGVGHTVGNQFRDVKSHSEYYWRPSKMGWMQPVGSGMMAAAPFTGPAAPFLLAGGAGLTVAGGIGGKVRQTHLERQAQREIARGGSGASYASSAEEQKKKNYLYMGIGAAALVTVAMVML